MIHKIFWLWLPVAFFCVQIVLEVVLPHDVLSALHSESGPHELVQFIVILFAAILAGIILMMPQIRADKFLMGWVGIAFLASIYIAGEEMSWGQHIWNWSTPEYWHDINDQGETNLHNTSSWLDQKPRLVLTLGVIIGGLAIPLLRRFKPSALPERFQNIYPRSTMIPIAVSVVLLIILDEVDDAMKDVTLFERISEVEEIYLFYFVLLYLWDLRKALLAKSV